MGDGDCTAGGASRELCRYREAVPLSAADIETAFQALSAELAARNERAKILVTGGAAMVLLFDARESTTAVDAYFVQPEAHVLHDAIAAVAQKLGLPANWLNEDAKEYLVGITFGEVLHLSESLEVLAASRVQLLAMKLSAWRDAVDRADAKLLLGDMDGRAEEIWAQVKRFIPEREMTKASFAFRDLWEDLYGGP